MGPIDITVRIDLTGLQRGHQAASQYTKRSTAQLINTSAYWIAVNAKAGSPFVTVERIDAELEVIVSPVIGKRGKPLKRKKVYSTKPQVVADRQVPSLAVMIIQARARPGSRYNQLTGDRWALEASPFKGKSRAAGRAAMAAAVDRMIKQRRSSPKFLLAGWIPVIQKMLAYTAQKFLPGVAGGLASDRAAWHGGHLGDASPAREGGLQVVAVIENDIGTEGKNRASQNRALWLHLAGPFQSAIDREGRRQMDYALKKYEEELARETNRHWS